MEHKDLIVGYVLQIERLNKQMKDYWEKIQKCIEGGHTDDAISLLNFYYSLETQLQRVEQDLKGTLHGYFPDK